jgi:hypothetical protein
MPRQSNHRPARRGVPQQIDLFAGEPQTSDNVPAWSGLPMETQAALTALMTRLMLDYSDKKRIGSMTGADHDH